MIKSNKTIPENTQVQGGDRPLKRQWERGKKLRIKSSALQNNVKSGELALPNMVPHYAALLSAIVQWWNLGSKVN